MEEVISLFEKLKNLLEQKADLSAWKKELGEGQEKDGQYFFPLDTQFLDSVVLMVHDEQVENVYIKLTDQPNLAVWTRLQQILGSGTVRTEIPDKYLVRFEGDPCWVEVGLTQDPQNPDTRITDIQTSFNGLIPVTYKG